MILTCPECNTRYLVPDSSIGAAGRTVRCASCRHSWFQQGPATAVVPPAPEPELAAPAQDTAAVEEREATSAPPEAPATATSYAAFDDTADAAPQTNDGDYDAFAHAPPFGRRKNTARRWTIAAAAAALVMVAALAAIQYFGTPGIAGLLGVGPAKTEVPLRLEVPRKPERREQPSGNELFAVSGRIVNPTQEVQIVPDILAELRDSSGRVVYSWRIIPPVRKLPPNGSTEFDGAEMDVPKNAKELNLSFSGAELKR